MMLKLCCNIFFFLTSQLEDEDTFFYTDVNECFIWRMPTIFTNRNKEMIQPCNEKIMS